MTDDRIARLINVTMLSVLTVAAFGLGTWLLATEFVRVREIYETLRMDDQRHVLWFITAVMMNLIWIGLLRQVVAGWFGRRRLRETS